MNESVEGDLYSVIEKNVGRKFTQRELLEGAAEEDAYLWHCMYRRLKNQPSSFDQTKLINRFLDQRVPVHSKQFKRLLTRHRPYLIQFLSDQHPIKASKKGRQTGASEAALSEELWFLDVNPYTKWMHTFHREPSANDFSRSRIKPALAETEYMKGLIGDINQVETKAIGDNSYLFIRSTYSEGMGEGVDLDGITFDEVDRMRDKVDIAFKEALEASPFGWMRYISTPTIAGRGIDIPWMQSDQKHWFVKCSKCGERQPIKFPDNYIQVKDVPKHALRLPAGTYDFLCRKEKCRGKLDRMDGQWVASFPDRLKEEGSISGYHIPQAIFIRHTATSIMQKKTDYKFRSLWDNYALGETSEGSSVLLNQAILDASSVPYKWPVPRRTVDFTNITVGIDWGSPYNWVVVIGRCIHNGYNYLLNAFRVEDVFGDELAQTREIIRRILPYQPDMIVADAGFGKDRNSLLYRTFPDTFWICQYSTVAKKKQTSVQTKWNEPDRIATLDRTLALRTLCMEFKLDEFCLPEEDVEDSGVLKAHLLNLKPFVQEEDGQVFETISSSGPDHYAHALLYARIAQSRYERDGAFDFETVESPL